jgi:Domain of unknown function (DUF5664)
VQELRKLNESINIDKEIPKCMLNGIPLVLAEHPKAGIGSQCHHCAFYTEDDECPKSGKDNDLYCNIHPHNYVWQVDPAIYVETKSQAKPLEASSVIPDALGLSTGRKYDSGKPMYSLVPVDALEEVVKVLTAGALRYNEPISEENWRKVDHPQFRYFSAAQRHMAADRKGELLDKDKLNTDGSISKGTDCYHLACAIASLMFMLQLKIEENTK